jgi:GNAT superfamily N-acetyltransferase
MEIRRYEPGEERELWRLYYNTTHRIVAQKYTLDQVNRWAPSANDEDAWIERLARSNPFVAVLDNRIVGFAELETNGHIDYFYCHHEVQSKGVGTALMQAVEMHAQSLGIKRLFAEVTTTGMHFFSARGFSIMEERNNIVCDAPAKQYLMEKHLDT